MFYIKILKHVSSTVILRYYYFFSIVPTKIYENIFYHVCLSKITPLFLSNPFDRGVRCKNVFFRSYVERNADDFESPESLDFTLSMYEREQLRTASVSCVSFAETRTQNVTLQANSMTNRTSPKPFCHWKKIVSLYVRSSRRRIAHLGENETGVCN